MLKLFFIKSRNSNALIEYKRKLRNSDDFVVPKPKLTFFTKTHCFLAPSFYNRLPTTLKKEKNYNKFCKGVKEFVMKNEHLELYFFNIIS